MALPQRLYVEIYILGIQMYRWKRYNLASRLFQLAAERSAEDWTLGALKWQGAALAKAGHIARAQDVYRRCADLAVYGVSGRAAISLARLLEESQADVDGAIDAYRMAVRLGAIDAIHPLASLLDARGDKQKRPPCERGGASCSNLIRHSSRPATAVHLPGPQTSLGT
jgi:tetratricopeptide (TPR) repeat protein